MNLQTRAQAASEPLPASRVITPTATSAHHWTLFLPATACIFVLVVALQWWSGAYAAEFGGHPDEPAHYVTGLMVRDYLASGAPGSPMAFAQRYYDHYPKVALGNWPPGFYAVQALWTLVFSPQRMSILLLMAVLTTAVALVLLQQVARSHGMLTALVASALWVTFPIVQRSTGMVMTEIPIALFSLLATLNLGRYLQTERTRDSVLFGVYASAAIMTKGSGLVLALVPPLAVALSGRWPVLKRANFWYAVPIVLVLAGPWTYAFRDLARAGWQDPDVSVSYTVAALRLFPRVLLLEQGVITAIAAIIGVAAVARRGTSPVWAALIALMIAVPAFHVVVPASLDSRHLVQAMPAWACLAAAGAAWLRAQVVQRDVRFRWVPAAAVVAGLIATAWPPLPKSAAGYAAVVRDFVQPPEHAEAVFLVASDTIGEGEFIAEAAMRERRPGHVIRRASKLLSQQSWHGGAYAMTVSQPEELVATMRAAGIAFVIVDESVPPDLVRPHLTLLRTTIAGSPHFELRGTYPVTRQYPNLVDPLHYEKGISVYAFRTAPPRGPR